jgi:hypothetical protein
MTDLVPQAEIRAIQQDKLFNAKPQEMIENAAEYARVLAAVIEKQKLYTVMQGNKKHVNIEGWTTLGTMLGFLPREVSVVEHEDGTFEAVVQLYNLQTGQIVGQASSICGADEKTWSNRPKYARRSMAITRATGKAYRLGFGWVMALAGYSPTPEEEMPEEKKAVELYAATGDQADRLEKMLKAKKVPEAHWAQIADFMHEKPMNKKTLEDAIYNASINTTFS